MLAVSLALAVAGDRLRHPARREPRRVLGHASVNRLMGFDARPARRELVLWHWKHNIFHHTYTNIDGADHDSTPSPFARLAPDQRATPPAPLPAHLHLGALRVLLPKWHLVDDFQNASRRASTTTASPARAAGRWRSCSLGKAVFFAWALVIPMLFHRWWVVAGLLRRHGVPGRADCSPSSSSSPTASRRPTSPPVPEGSKRVSDGWAAHQVADDRRLRARQPRAHLVPRRPELPDRAPPVPEALPPPLPGDLGRRRGGLRGVRGALTSPTTGCSGRCRFALAMAAAHGPRLTVFLRESAPAARLRLPPKHKQTKSASGLPAGFTVAIFGGVASLRALFIGVVCLGTAASARGQATARAAEVPVSGTLIGAGGRRRSSTGWDSGDGDTRRSTGDRDAAESTSECDADGCARDCDADECASGCDSDGCTSGCAARGLTDYGDTDPQSTHPNAGRPNAGQRSGGGRPNAG